MDASHSCSENLLTVRALLLLMALLLAAGCDATGPDDGFRQEYVVESYQIAGEPLQEVLLSRTTPASATFDYDRLAVRGAAVALDVLREDGSVLTSYTYEEDSERPGVYEPIASRRAVRVQPLRRYRLRALIPQGGGEEPAQITATTVVPDTFRVVSVNTDDVVYQQEEQVTLHVTRSQSPGREQAYYILTVESLLDQLREEELTPFAARFFQESNDEDLTLEDFRVATSPILNEANYKVNPDGTLTIKLPWLAIAFYGLNRLYANAIDDNLFDFVRTQQAQQGGSTLGPGEIPNVIEHIEGGTGIFGSLARQHFDITVRREEEESE